MTEDINNTNVLKKNKSLFGKEEIAFLDEYTQTNTHPSTSWVAPCKNIQSQERSFFSSNFFSIIIIFLLFNFLFSKSNKDKDSNKKKSYTEQSTQPDTVIEDNTKTKNPYKTEKPLESDIIINVEKKQDDSN